MLKIATSRNKVIKTDLSITYKIEHVKSWYVATRYATKTYSIIDLDAESAAVIANQRVALYTRPYSVLIPSDGDTMPSTRSLTNCLAKVYPRHDTGPVWRVDVNVDETDVKVSATEPADPATLFTAENARDYDETDDIAKTAVVTSAEYDGTNAVIAFSSNFGDDVICQKFNTTSNAWEPIFIQPSGGTITIPNGLVGGGDRVRVISGRTKSNDIVVSGQPPPPFVAMSVSKSDYNKISGLLNANIDIAPGKNLITNGSAGTSIHVYPYKGSFIYGSSTYAEARRDDLSSAVWNFYCTNSAADPSLIDGIKIKIGDYTTPIINV